MALKKITFRTDTDANWTQANAIPRLGEPVLVRPSVSGQPFRLKIGDGTNSYPDLQFIGGTSGDPIPIHHLSSAYGEATGWPVGVDTTNTMTFLEAGAQIGAFLGSPDGVAWQAAHPYDPDTTDVNAYVDAMWAAAGLTEPLSVWAIIDLLLSKIPDRTPTPTPAPAFVYDPVDANRVYASASLSNVTYTADNYFQVVPVQSIVNDGANVAKESHTWQSPDSGLDVTGDVVTIKKAGLYEVRFYTSFGLGLPLPGGGLGKIETYLQYGVPDSGVALNYGLYGQVVPPLAAAETYQAARADVTATLMLGAGWVLVPCVMVYPDDPLEWTGTVASSAVYVRPLILDPNP